MADEVKQNAPEFSGCVKAATQMDAILRDVQANEKRVKKARAEVLAACINAICVLCRTEEKPRLQSFGGKNWEGRYQAWVHDRKLEGQIVVETCSAGAIHSLQPAAKDLEELLQKAKEIGWNEAVEIAIKWNELSFSQDSFTKWMHIQRLEKARASEEKS